jgi:hypothetical protein
MNITINRLLTRRVLLGGAGLLCTAVALAGEKLVMPRGMGGVPDIGAIPCSVFNEMTVVGPLGTRHSLLTWSAGYLQALTGKSLQEVVDGADSGNAPWTYDRLADALAGYCAKNPQALTRDAAASLSRSLGVAGAAPVAAPGR